nr:MAG TPA: hypothetical protein [Caudoviricetes sp.]
MPAFGRFDSARIFQNFLAPRVKGRKAIYAIYGIACSF